MNILKEIKFNGEKPGIDFGKITFYFDEIDNADAVKMTADWRDGQDVIINKINKNTVVGILSTNDPKSWLNEKFTQPGVQWFFS